MSVPYVSMALSFGLTYAVAYYIVPVIPVIGETWTYYVTRLAGNVSLQNGALGWGGVAAIQQYINQNNGNHGGKA